MRYGWSNHSVIFQFLSQQQPVVPSLSGPISFITSVITSKNRGSTSLYPHKSIPTPSRLLVNMSSPPQSPSAKYGHKRTSSRFTEELDFKTPASDPLFTTILSEMDQYDARHHSTAATSAHCRSPIPRATLGHKKHSSLSSIGSSASSNSSLPAWLHVPIDRHDRRHSVDNQQPPTSDVVTEKESAGEKIKGRLRALTGGSHKRPMGDYQAT